MSVRPLVRNAFVKIAENGVMQDGDASYVVYMALFFDIFPLGETGTTRNPLILHKLANER